MRVAFFASLALAAFARTVLYQRSSVPAEWTVGARAPADATLEFTVALKQQNLDELDRLFWDLSDPNSVNYGKYLTSEQVRALTAATPDAVSSTLTFLADGGCKCQDLKDALACEGSVASLESLFATSFHVMTHTSGRTIVRHMGGLSIPDSLAAHVEFVSGLGMFPVPKLGKEPKPVPEAGNYDDDPFFADYHVVPETIEQFYSLQTAVGSPASTQGVGEFVNEPAYLETDFKTFQTNVNLAITDPIIVGPFITSSPSAESTLDIQYIGSTGKNNTNYFESYTGWMYEFTQTFISAKDRPAVLSMSYAWSELDQCNPQIDGAECTTLGVNAAGYIARVSTEFKKIGALGVTLLAASGDSGAHGRTDEDCDWLDDPQALNMFPPFPASSPYVTTVGGTQIAAGKSEGAKAPVCQPPYLKCATGGYEIVSSTATLSEIVSGGGFSWSLPQPSYQSTVVNKYLTNSSALPAAKYFNASGRGFPDVAALAHKYYIQYGGAISAVDGTSCATPVWGGIIGLLNAYRLSAKLPVIGFANPLLYQIYHETPDAFTDIVEGSNACTEDGCSCPNGFKAAPGWDATTGLGSPVYPKLLAAVKAIDARRTARIAAVAQTA